MKLNTQQKVIIGIFALALVGLVCDRVFLLPRQVAAQATDQINARKSGFIFAVNPIPEESDADVGIKDRLNERLPDETLDVNQVRDAFTLSSGWLANQRLDHTTSTTEDTAFKQEYHLQAIMFQDEIKAVYMNDKVVRIGDSVDGYELVALSETSATFSVNGVRIELRLD